MEQSLTTSLCKSQDSHSATLLPCSPEINVPYNTFLGTICPNLDATNQYPGDPIWQSFEEQIKFSFARGPHPKWPELSDAMQEAIQETLTGIKTPARATADAAAKIRQINASIR